MTPLVLIFNCHGRGLGTNPARLSNFQQKVIHRALCILIDHSIKIHILTATLLAGMDEMVVVEILDTWEVVRAPISASVSPPVEKGKLCIKR